MPANSDQKLSRRRFLETTVVSGVVATAATPAVAKASDPERERLERLVETYGSELGKIRRVG